MGVANVPAAAGGGIKTVQRGSAGASGNVTITEVDISKSFVNIFGTASSGSVSASFNMSMNAGTVSIIGQRSLRYQSSSQPLNTGFRPSGSTAAAAVYQGSVYSTHGAWTQDRTVNSGNASVGAGTNNLVSAVVQGFLANSTTLTVSGACRFEVVEFA